MHHTLALATLGLLLRVATASNVVIFDSSSASYLQPGSQAMQLQKPQLSSVIAAVTGLLPAGRIDEGLSALLGSFVKPSALKKPSAYAVFNVGGLTPESARDVFQGKQERALDLQGKGCVVKMTIDALTQVASANPSAALRVVDQHGLQECDSECLQSHLTTAASKCQSQYESVDAPMKGKLTLSNGAVLDLSQGADRMFAVELASVSAGLQNQLDALSKRAELKAKQEDTELYEVNVMGLHALTQKYGADSQEVVGARDAVTQLLIWAVQELDAAYDGDIVYQVTLSAKAPATGVKAMTSWKDQTRRQLLQVTWAAPDEATAAKKFSAKAAGYGAFILLLYFSLAAMHCMCNMPFKTDTLLFPGKKD